MDYQHDGVVNSWMRFASLIPSPIFWLDLNLHFAGGNPAFLDAFELGDVSQLIGENLNQVLPAPIAEKIIGQCQIVIGSGQKQTVAAQFEQRNFVSLCVPLANRRNTVNGIMCICVELQAESSKQPINETQPAIDKRDKLTVLAQKMAHDIQSPLSAMLMVLNHCDELPKEKKSLLTNAANSIKNMTSNLLDNYRANDSSQIVREEKKPIHLADFLQKVLCERRVQYQALPIYFDLHISAQAQTALIVAQPGQLSRAVSNLIANAVDALRDVENGGIKLTLDANDDHVTLTIADNGKGMPQEMVQKIMSRRSFTAGKLRGHGLGLTQVWDMVEFNAARLDVSSEPLKGTMFKLTFSLARKSPWLVQENISRYQVERFKTAQSV